MTCADYEEWVASKFDGAAFDGIDGADISGALYPHQRDLVQWALRRGRAAIFADTGLGKTAMQLEWARHVAKRGRVLILAPLAVGSQTEHEGEKFGVECKFSRHDAGHRITIANYEMLHAFDPSEFAGIVLDESSILKSFTGKTRNALIDSFSGTPFRLCCTATPAPNDHMELGNHSEFLGYKSRVEMLSEYFCHDGGSTKDWRIKGHAYGAFWEWVTSWGIVVKLPSDLGYDDGGFALPPLELVEHVIPVDHRDAWSEGYLFAPDTRTLAESRAVRRATMGARVARAAELVSHNKPAVVWCELNAEADMATRAIDGAIQVKGSDSSDAKCEALDAFADGRARVLVTKPSIAGFGLNWQHCASMVFMGASYSYEQTYQAIRRCWRFGQSSPVKVHILRAETEEHVIAAYRRKEADAARMASEMTAAARDSILASVRGGAREWSPYVPSIDMEIPTWVGDEQ